MANSQTHTMLRGPELLHHNNWPKEFQAGQDGGNGCGGEFGVKSPTFSPPVL